MCNLLQIWSKIIQSSTYEIKNWNLPENFPNFFVNILTKTRISVQISSIGEKSWKKGKVVESRRAEVTLRVGEEKRKQA